MAMFQKLETDETPTLLPTKEEKCLIPNKAYFCYFFLIAVVLENHIYKSLQGSADCVINRKRIFNSNKSLSSSAAKAIRILFFIFPKNSICNFGKRISPSDQLQVVISQRVVSNTAQTSHEMLQLTLDTPVDQRVLVRDPFVKARGEVHKTGDLLQERSVTAESCILRKPLCLSIPLKILRNMQFLFVNSTLFFKIIDGNVVHASPIARGKIWLQLQWNFEFFELLCNCTCGRINLVLCTIRERQ